MFFLFLFITAVYLQERLGYNALTAGIALAPLLVRPPPPNLPVAGNRKTVRAWEMDDLEGSLDLIGRDPVG